MPIVLEDLKMVIEFAEKEEKNIGTGKLGDLLAEIGRKVKGANPEEDVRRFREDEDVFD